MRLKRQWSEFKSIVSDRKLQIFLGESRSDYYHLLAIDGQITYECMIIKNSGADQVDYETNYQSGITNRISESPDWDLMLSSFPSSTTELQTYKKNNITVQTVLVTYTTSSKNFISSIQKVRF